MAGFPIYRLTIFLTSGVLLSTSIKYVWRHVILDWKKAALPPAKAEEEEEEEEEEAEATQTAKPVKKVEAAVTKQPTRIPETAETSKTAKTTERAEATEPRPQKEARRRKTKNEKRKDVIRDDGACQVEDQVQTVLGLIHRDTLGTTIIRDQINLDYREHKPGFLKSLGSDRRKTNHEASYEEFTSFGEMTGGGAIVDTSPFTLTRDPEELAHLSIVSGVTIVMSTGDYIASSVVEGTDMDQKTVSDVAVRYIYELEHGVGASSIRPGLIGELGISHPITPDERKNLEAAAIACLETGVPISIHPGSHPDSPLEIAGVLLQLGVSPHKIIVGHVEGCIPPDAAKARMKLAKTGVYMQFDVFGTSRFTFRANSEKGRAKQIAELVKQGYGDRVLVSHGSQGAGAKSAKKVSSTVDFYRRIIPLLMESGLSGEQVNTIIVHNPARALSVPRR